MITKIADIMEWAFNSISADVWIMGMVVLAILLWLGGQNPLLGVKMLVCGIVIYFFLRVLGFILPDWLENVVAITVAVLYVVLLRW